MSHTNMHAVSGAYATHKYARGQWSLCHTQICTQSVELMPHTNMHAVSGAYATHKYALSQWSLCHTQICTRSVELMPHTHMCTRSVELMPHTHMCTRVVIVEGPQDLQNMHKHTEHSDLNSHRHNLCNLIICGDNSTFHPETRQSYFWQRGIIDMQPNIPQTLTHTSAYFGKRE